MNEIDKHWLVRKATIRKLWIGFALSLAATVLSGLLVHQHEPFGVHQEEPLAALPPLEGVEAPRRPPFSVPPPDWESTTAAEGRGSLPAATRAPSRRESFIRSQVPSMRHSLK